MTKRLTITYLVVAVAFLAAAPARATIGSVISSFAISSSSRNGIYGEGNYVYLSERITGYDYIGKYTVSGSFVTRVEIDRGNPYPLYGGSRTHLGSGYVALYDYYINYLKIFSTTKGGAPVASFSAPGNTFNFFWDGAYYYFNRPADRGRFVCYSSSGVYIRAWTCAGWPSSMTYCYGAEYAKRGNRGAGPYFVAGAGSPSRPYCMTTFPGGSLVGTWTLPSPYLAYLSYGDSSNPGVYGAAIWGSTWSPYSVYEIDIDARNASKLVPVSVGKVKALYR
jgi:hypothetical protein